MVPAFTIVTTIITIAVTALLIVVIYRLNDPARQRSRGGPGETAVVADGNRGDRGDAGFDGGGGGGGGD
jgi:hypothetical protein